MRPSCRHPLAALLPALLACTASHAGTRQLQAQGLRVSWDSQALPDSSWSAGVTGTGTPYFFLPNGYVITDAWQPVFRFSATANTATLQPLALHLDFAPPPLTRLPDGNYLRVSAHPDQAYVSSVGMLTAPAGAQLATSFGYQRLDLDVDGGSEHVSAASGPLVATATGLSQHLEIHAPGSGWLTAPPGSGTWDLRLSASLIGSYHLLPSTDPDCESLACMPGLRATATLQQIDLVIPTSYDLVYASSVPEPPSSSLMLLGGLAAGLRLLRRRAR